MRRIVAGLSAAVAILAASLAVADDPLRHRMGVRLIPAEQTLQVVDRIRLPPELAAAGSEFLLSSALEIHKSEPQIEIVPTGDVADVAEGIRLTRYRLGSDAVDGEVMLAYAGRIDYGLSDQKEEYTRGFRETAGIIGDEGVYLGGEGYWYPRFDDRLIEFEMEVEQPEGWQIISQGDGTPRGDDGRARWTSGAPMEEIFLTGGPLTVYRESAGAVEALVLLHEADDALAAKYLTTTAQYIEMYRQLIGPYPYGKFALVENFWETGYGMPSFTLLGPRVIRFPFILHSSFPHEILHNWWGNSVFVDYEQGNWCEGLTAYLADHLIQEQRGKGESYRRDTLQKYRNYVKDGRDFPLAEFRSRHSGATEAVGYGKALMGFHMLRRRLGDDTFVVALQRLYRTHRGKRASFGDLRKAFEAAGDQDLSRFFDEWTRRTGAATIGVSVTEVREDGDGYVVSGSLEQTQPGEPFALEVPVALTTTSSIEETVFGFDRASQSFEIRTADRPLLLQVDPLFDLFRQLDPREIPPSIGEIFGAPRILAVLPAAAGSERLEGYRGLLDGWQSESHEIEIVLDAETEALPVDRSIWIVGRDNEFADDLFAGKPPEAIAVAGETIDLDGETVAFADHSLVVLRRHPRNLERAVGWLVVEPQAALPGMGRKLPHYGKYSYLAFEGDEPTNVVKGQWAATESPLRVDLRDRISGEGTLPAQTLAKRTALAELPPVFSEKALAEHVVFLASDKLEGRGIGTAGLQQAADYVARQFEAAGLAPAGDDGTYFQRFTVPDGPDGQPHEVANVLGYLPGTQQDWKDQAVVLAAHYDHLGRGWPDAHREHEGRIHPGADDNASGVAVLIELARNFASGDAPKRNLVFAAFAAEEADRLGSRHYVEHPAPVALEGFRGVVNLDTIGRLGTQKLSVLGTGTADEWQHIFRGVSFVTGVESRNVPGSAEGSDQWSFIEKGIPAVQIFTSAHADYHRPSDTVEQVDTAGLVKVATFVKEAMAYMVEREKPMRVTIAGAETPAAPRASTGGRRVSFGSIPEFSYAGPGVQLSGVVPGSPAEQAGLQEGDVLLRIDETEIADLRQFSQLLRSLEPGQRIQATVRRGEEELTVPVTVQER